MNFILSGLTYLKFFVPLIDEGNKRGIKSTMYVTKSGKYNCPYNKQNSEQLKACSKDFNFDIRELSSDSPDESPCFLVEGSDRESARKSRKKISLCCSTDFTALFDSYVDEVDHIVMNSKFVAERYGKISEKNTYLGSPKFDLKTSREETERKYSLANTGKRAVIFYPRGRDQDKSPIEKTIFSLKKLGFEVILKSRGKDPISRHHSSISDRTLYDASWHPHTSLELIVASDIVINYSSSVIEETTFYEKPMINFHVKPFVKPLDFLYEYDFVINANPVFDYQEFSEACHQLLSKDHKSQYEQARHKLLGSFNSSSDIIESIL